MKKFIVLVMVLVSIAHGTQHLTINGQETDSITLSLDETCTIEVVSVDGAVYTNSLTLNNLGVSDLILLEIKPEAGADAWVTNPSESSYNLHTGGAGLLTGVHFVFQYIATEPGAKNIELREMIGVLPIDSVQITVSNPDPTGTAFSYQGRLTDDNTPVHGPYDLEFKLYRSVTADIPTATVIKEAVEIYYGYFTVDLDFGSDPFNGDARWLGIGARPGVLADPNAYTIFSPRQKITPAPYSIYADQAQNAANAGTLDGMQAADFRPAGDIKQLVQDFVVASGETVTAGDVVSYLNGSVRKGYNTDNTLFYGPEQAFGTGYFETISAAALSSTVSFRQGCVTRLVGGVIIFVFSSQPVK